MKEPSKRGTYAQLLQHPFLVDDRTREVDMVAWVESAIAARGEARKAARAPATAASVVSPAESTASNSMTLTPSSTISASTASSETAGSDETIRS